MSHAENAENNESSTWLAPDQAPVYGLTPGAAMPAEDAPWEFDPMRRPQEIQFQDRSPQNVASPSVEYAPDPFGPAKTPQERAAELGIPYPHP